ncbi:MAG: ectonucleotide pyrophosphatase/phosphodiesterase [Clostridiales bacterium]|nr:ectonucleotide pyrophosphatase/phosphodiesterase [Clostridiales bacterium]MDY3746464.1 ectonucleotide pyrophosphatase/phosphodiesterase [Lachnospiraceae bacterium]
MKRKNLNCKKRMLVISLDAVGGADYDYLKTLPNFSKFLEGACLCTDVQSVYPSITYPAHTTIITGRMPKNHGIINNTLVMPGALSPDWYWQRKYIRGTTLYDEAVKKGMKVAALLWPVTAKAKIQYNMPEIFANRPWSNQILTSMSNGSILYQAKMNSMFGHLRNGKSQPALDNFVHQALLYTLSHYKPDLTLVHWTDVDSTRHLYGVHGPEVTEALNRHDKRLGEMMALLKKMGIDEETNIVLLGDHYQKDVRRIIYLNHVLKEKGYLKTDGQKVRDWKAICKNCDGSAYIYLKKGFAHLEKEIYQLFNDMKDDENSGIKAVYTRQEAADKGADPRCAVMLEAAEGCYFLDEWRCFSENVMVDEGQSKTGHMMAVHGYDPTDKGYGTIFMAKGPDFNKNVRIPTMHLADEGVTMAKILGLDLGKTDGHAIDAFICKQ